MSQLQYFYKKLHQPNQSSQPRCLWCLEKFEPIEHLSDIFIKPKTLCRLCHNRLKFSPKVLFLNGVKVTSFYQYDEEFSKLLIQYKEQRDIVLSQVFSQFIGFLGLKYFNRAGVLMPSSKEKLETRGFNHLELMYESCGLNLISPFIKSGKQVGKGKMERAKVHFEQIEEVPKRVVLLDDVMTTGATLKEAIRLLKGKNIVCFVLGHVDLK